ncbi:PilZ domain-containing protein [Desulfatiferula olefinivorans]
MNNHHEGQMEKKGMNSVEDRRRHSRKTCFFAEVDYAAGTGVYTDPIKDICPGGVFIETDKNLSIGEDITMLFSDFARIDLLRVSGDIVRVMPSGVAVRFDFDDDGKKKNMERFIDKV